MPPPLFKPSRWLASLLAAASASACLDASPAAPAPVAMASTPVLARVAAAPELAARRLKGALFGHADLQPRQAAYVSEYSHPEFGHPALKTFSLFQAQGSLVDDTRAPSDHLALAERLAIYPPGPAADPALGVYLALPVAQRQQDILVWVQDKYRWSAPEYRTAGGKPLPYTSSYVLHLAPATGGGTDIQVLGYNSQVKTGAGFRRAHDDLVPFSYQDTMVDVPPSRADRQALLGVLVRLAAVDPPT